MGAPGTLLLGLLALLGAPARSLPVTVPVPVTVVVPTTDPVPDPNVVPDSVPTAGPVTVPLPTVTPPPGRGDGDGGDEAEEPAMAWAPRRPPVPSPLLGLVPKLRDLLGPSPPPPGDQPPKYEA
ncbi:tetra-peptide repeat homeobox protein 1-like [Caloenas nicobarica]|uniref:tetra-peptide repeat homeobox protein 1-like n=1 Tax=Caloenas nicobarica TaxID=187106 RepID=UPI0032B7B8B3